MVLKFLLHVSVINYHQGAYCICIAKVIIVKQSVKIRGYGINLAVWLHIYPVLVVCVQCTVQSETLHGALYTVGRRVFFKSRTGLGILWRVCP